MPKSQMPKGVEHTVYYRTNYGQVDMPKSQMPKGVEH